MNLWRVWSKHHGTFDMDNMTPEQWTEIHKAAGFTSVCGWRADSLVADEKGSLWILDTCAGSHAVDPELFVAVANATDQRAGEGKP